MWTVLRLTSKASLSQTWPYAGKSEYPTLLRLVAPKRGACKGSENVMGADDQQERPRG